MLTLETRAEAQVFSIKLDLSSIRATTDPLPLLIPHSPLLLW